MPGKLQILLARLLPSKVPEQDKLNLKSPANPVFFSGTLNYQHGVVENPSFRQNTLLYYEATMPEHETRTSLDGVLRDPETEEGFPSTRKLSVPPLSCAVISSLAQYIEVYHSLSPSSLIPDLDLPVPVLIIF